MSELYHHGVKGQKWGIRRFQNKDGSLTYDGRKHYLTNRTYRYVARTSNKVQSIVNTMSNDERRKLGGDPNKPYMDQNEIQSVAKRFLKENGDIPIAFLDIYYATNSGTIVIGTNRDYRGKGNAADLVKKAKKWLETPQAQEILGMNSLNWFALRNNEASINLAKKSGFKDRSDYEEDEEWWGGRYTPLKHEQNIKVGDEMNELYHHGIDGQKWGIRNGPPYPLDSGKKRKFHYTSPEIERTKKEWEYILAKTIPFFGIAISMKYLAGIIAYKVNSYDNTNYRELDGPIEKIKNLKKKDKEMSMKEDMKVINKRSNIFNQGRVNNCPYCTMALEMRQRGYDVMARRSTIGLTDDDIITYFKGMKFSKIGPEYYNDESRKKNVLRTYNRICDILESYGEGSRGCISFTYEKAKSGHILNWKVENGNVNFYDSQSRKVNDTKTISLADPSTMEFARLDNLKPSDKITELIMSRKEE